MRKWNKNSNFLKIKWRRMGIREHMMTEDKNDAWACKCIDTKLDGSDDNNIFLKK